jgi:hypothetical protein
MVSILINKVVNNDLHIIVDDLMKPQKRILCVLSSSWGLPLLSICQYVINFQKYR